MNNTVRLTGLARRAGRGEPRFAWRGFQAVHRPEHLPGGIERRFDRSRSEPARSSSGSSSWPATATRWPSNDQVRVTFDANIAFASGQSSEHRLLADAGVQLHPRRRRR
ncbi:MAG: hypothetical protein MZV65_29070 [Chromatiales bacterium]|nr:hypothetical protein [Chromatiales bacterium]